MFHLNDIQFPFIVNLLILLLSAKLLGELAERFRQPSMIGEVMAGVILGPSLFNLIPGPGDIKIIAELGVFMLIIMAGMEIEIEEIRRSISGKNLWISVLGFMIPLASGIATGLIFNFSNTFTAFLGLCMAITALPVSVRILMDLGKLQTDVGQRIISAAIFNDIFALLILGIILDFNDVTKNLKDLAFSIGYTMLKVFIFIAILMVSYKLFKLTKQKVHVINPKVNQFFLFLRGQESLFALVILFVLIFSSIAELLGIHFIVGAFFGAILIPRSMFASHDFERVHRSISGITMGFLAPVFFATMGLSFVIQSIGNITLLLFVLLASFLSKIFGGYAGGRLAGFDSRKSLTIGIGLNARGIMELVIANIALQNGFIDISVYTILVLMALSTTILTPFLLKKSFIRIDLS